MTLNDAASHRECANPAEALQRIEAEVRGLTRRGVCLSSALHHLGVSIEVYRTAWAFARTSDRYKLRALVEDWTFRTIRAGLSLSAAAPGRGIQIQSAPRFAGTRRSSACWLPLAALLTACLLRTA